ncbi:MAG: hypothetical protein L0H31_07025 [Nocardioidaceae bacterium]|nr:hypothetical protein [Nocardioidaceae bacterium]
MVVLLGLERQRGQVALRGRGVGKHVELGPLLVAVGSRVDVEPVDLDLAVLGVQAEGLGVGGRGVQPGIDEAVDEFAGAGRDRRHLRFGGLVVTTAASEQQRPRQQDRGEDGGDVDGVDGVEQIPPVGQAPSYAAQTGCVGSSTEKVLLVIGGEP